MHLKVAHYKKSYLLTENQLTKSEEKVVVIEIIYCLEVLMVKYI